MTRRVVRRNARRVSRGLPRSTHGYTLLELLIAVAILGILAGIVAVNVMPLFARARQVKAETDIRAIERMLQVFELTTGHLPDSLHQLPGVMPLDPWGRPYQYLRIRGGGGPRGRWRKDRFLVPLNNDFDLYSMGPDGKSRPPLTARHSHDDIVRAGNGSFVGPATEY